MLIEPSERHSQRTLVNAGISKRRPLDLQFIIYRIQANKWSSYKLINLLRAYKWTDIRKTCRNQQIVMVPPWSRSLIIATKNAACVAILGTVRNGAAIVTTVATSVMSRVTWHRCALKNRTTLAVVIDRATEREWMHYITTTIYVLVLNAQY